MQKVSEIVKSPTRLIDVLYLSTKFKNKFEFSNEGFEQSTILTEPSEFFKNTDTLNELRLKFEQIFSEEKFDQTSHPEDVIFNTLYKLNTMDLLPLSLVQPANSFV